MAPKAEKIFNLTRDMLDPGFADLVAPDREKLLTCIQCGTCTASCQTAYAMDYTPRQLWRLIQLGLKDEVLSSNSFWLCTACYLRTLRCLRGIACRGRRPLSNSLPLSNTRRFERKGWSCLRGG